MNTARRVLTRTPNLIGVHGSTLDLPGRLTYQQAIVGLDTRAVARYAGAEHCRICLTNCENFVLIQ